MTVRGPRAKVVISLRCKKHLPNIFLFFTCCFSHDLQCGMLKPCDRRYFVFHQEPGQHVTVSIYLPVESGVGRWVGGVGDEERAPMSELAVSWT